MKNLLLSFCILLTMLPAAVFPQLTISIVSLDGYTITCSKPVLVFAATTNYSGTTNYMWSGPQGSFPTNTVSITVPGIYTIAATAGSLTATETLAIATNTTRPQLLPGSPGIISCQQQKASLSATASPGNCNFIWSGPAFYSCTSATCDAYVVGVYSVTAIDPLNGCSTSSSVVIMDNYDYPLIESAKVFTVACPGIVPIYPVVLSAPVNYSYEWKSEVVGGWQAGNAGTITVSSPGAYTVTVTSILTGCSSSAVIFVFACTGMEEPLWTKLLVYPIPAANDLAIDLPLAGDVTITLHDLGGKLMFQALYNSKAILDLRELPSGIYTLGLLKDNYVLHKKIAVLH